MEQEDEQIKRLNEYQDLIKKDLEIDYVNLDDASLETPKLYGKYLTYLSDETILLSKMDSMMKKVYKKRWSYYMGRASEEVYKKEPLREKINKQEISKYLDADEVLSEMKMRIEKQKIIVRLLEDTLKAISTRQYSVKDAIQWRMFQAGER